MSGDTELTPRGELVADRLIQSQESGEQRWDAIARETVSAILAGRPWNVEAVDGRTVEDDERMAAIARLQRWDVVAFQRRADGRVHSVFPASRIYEVAAITGPLRRYFEGDGGGSYADQRVTANVSGGTVGAIQGGSNNSMNVTIVGPPEQAVVLAKVAEILTELERVEGAERLVEAVAGIREVAAQPEPSKPGLRAKVVEAMAVAGATHGVERVTHLLAQLLGVV